MFLIGFNHKTAPIEVREKIFLNPSQQDLLLSQLKAHPQVTGAFVLSTCNRIEVYIKRIDPHVDGYFILDLIRSIKKIDDQLDLRSYAYTLDNKAAIEHLFQVSCGLDSLVLGEKQILGQVKLAVERARAMNVLDKYLNLLTHQAIRAGKMAQHQTDISAGGGSISWAAIEMAQQYLGANFEGSKVLIMGAGKMGAIALSQLKKRGVGKIYLMNRTGQKAEDLSQEFGCIPASFFDMKEILQDIDVCFCCVGAPHYVLDKEMMTRVMALRDGRRLTLIDISMPRNIDPAVAELPGIHLAAIDDLEVVVTANLQRRQEAVNNVDQIIQKKIDDFKVKLKKLQSNTGSDYFEPQHA